MNNKLDMYEYLFVFVLKFIISPLKSSNTEAKN